MQKSSEQRIPNGKVGKLEWVMYSPEGGMLAKFLQEKYPTHGLLVDEGLWATEMLKKYVIGWVMMGKYLNPLILTKKGIDKWLRQFERYTESVVERYVNPDLFSPAVKEFYRVGTKLWSDRQIAIKGFSKIGEDDRAYRWRAQDLAMAANQQELIDHPAREVSRLVKIYLRREKRKQYKIIGFLVRIMLFLRGDIRKAISDFAREADWEKFKMDRFDFHHALREEAYDYDDKGIDERIELVNRL